MLRSLRLIGLLEGISLLVLLGVAMPLKYALGEPMAVEIVGMLHGVLFLAYVFFVLLVGITKKWKIIDIGLAMLASLIPFGTFYADRKLFEPSM
tara:strand:- start:35 stop:316 length:282 start_codon:yes stop_codon:yes gene_type:complete